MHNIPDIIIAIDGYSSTGKSSFAKLIAKEFSFLYLDSGALYRAVTLYAMEHGMVREDGSIDKDALVAALKDIDIHFEYSPEGSHTFIGDQCVDSQIRTLAVSSHVSPVAVIPQRQPAKPNSAAVASSTRGYRTLMPVPQAEHLPRRSR